MSLKFSWQDLQDFFLGNIDFRDSSGLNQSYFDRKVGN